MNQYTFENNHLKLTNSKTSRFARIVLYVITFLCFTLPLFGIFTNIIDGNGIKFGGVLAFGVFCVLGFYLLRLSLWNSYGKEIIEFHENEIIYIADYRWFKDGKKSLGNFDVTYSIKAVGYIEDDNGVLIISNGESAIESAVAMPKQQVEELTSILKNRS